MKGRKRVSLLAYAYAKNLLDGIAASNPCTAPVIYHVHCAPWRISYAASTRECRGTVETKAVFDYTSFSVRFLDAQVAAAQSSLARTNRLKAVSSAIHRMGAVQLTAASVLRSLRNVLPDRLSGNCPS